MGDGINGHIEKDYGILDRCPNSDGNACEQYRLQGMRCQDCPTLKPIEGD